MWINLGIVVSGLGVMIFRSSIPDLIVGFIVAVISLIGGWKILKNAQETKRARIKI